MWFQNLVNHFRKERWNIGHDIRWQVSQIHSMEKTTMAKKWYIFILELFCSYWFQELFWTLFCYKNWDLRNSCLKQLAFLFHSFDKYDYLRLITYHIAELKTCPSEIIGYFAKGCFSISISGIHGHSVALGEDHEMEINIKPKMLWIHVPNFPWQH